MSFTATVGGKANSGNDVVVQARGFAEGAAIALVKSELAMQSGQNVTKVSIAEKLPIDGYAWGHSDDGQKAMLSIFSTLLQQTKVVAIQHMSVSNRSSINNGSVDITKIGGWMGAYNAANPLPGDWTLIKGEFVK